MNKMIAGLLGLALSVMMFATPAVAQNSQGRYDANVIGGVSYSLNSGGSFWGQLYNAGSSSMWSLGFGSTKSTVGTDVINWDSSGHVLLAGIGSPIVSSCGTNPSVAAGSDNAGDVTMGTATPVTTCTVTFNASYTNVPHCFATNRTSKLSVIAQATTTTVVFVGTGAGGFANSGDVIDYVCLGHI